MEEYISANAYGGGDASAVFQEKVYKLLADKKLKSDFTYLGIAIVHFRLRLIGKMTGKRTALLREQFVGSSEDNPRMLVAIRWNKCGTVNFILLFPPDYNNSKPYDRRDPLKRCCSIDSNLRTNNEFDVITSNELKVTKLDEKKNAVYTSGDMTDTFQLEDPILRKRQLHRRVLEISVLSPGHGTLINDPGGEIESNIQDTAGRKGLYKVLCHMAETGSIPKNFPSLSSRASTSLEETPSARWNSTEEMLQCALKEEYNGTETTTATSSPYSLPIAALVVGSVYEDDGIPTVAAIANPYVEDNCDKNLKK